MKNLTYKLVLSSLIGTLVISTAYAKNPSVSFLEEKYKLNNSEAKKRIDLQAKVIALSDRLNQLNDPDYADMYIQHNPTYQVIVLFKGNKDRTDFLKSLDPEIRPFVQIRQAQSSQSESHQKLNEINKTLDAYNIPFQSVYDLEQQKYLITVENKNDTNLIQRALLPQSRSLSSIGNISINIGNVPKIQAAPTGVQPGDRLYGGNPIWSNANATGARCTLGYAVSYKSGTTTKKGILTAGHCENAFFANMGNHDVLLYSPIIDMPHKAKDGISDKYDYQIWETTGLVVDNKIQYKDINGIPEFPASGILNLTSVTTFVNQKKGMIVCKSGAVTGITCGEILNGNATHDGVAGWILVGNSSQANISAGGDSGGPWFLYPGSSSNISGVGVHTAGSDNPDVSIYMPIDYIDDHISTVNTIKQ